MLFSERFEYVSPRQVLQIDSADQDLRVGIYNLLYQSLGQFDDETVSQYICKSIWADYWHFPIDEFPDGWWRFYPHLKDGVLKGNWYAVYDLIELVISFLPDDDEYINYCEIDSHYRNKLPRTSRFTELVNDVLSQYCSGYRLISEKLVRITENIEIESLEEAVAAPDKYAAARTHIQNSLEKFGLRPNPDYRNCIKEAISAVESVAQVQNQEPNESLGKALDKLKNNHDIHPSLIGGWKKLYGFTSDAAGIRHALDNGVFQADENLARYMLVSCSAFVNYLIMLDETSQNSREDQGEQI